MHRKLIYLASLCLLAFTGCSDSPTDPGIASPEAGARRELEETPQSSSEGTCWLKDGDIYCQGVSGYGLVETDCKTLYFDCPDDTGSGGSSFWGEGGSGGYPEAGGKTGVTTCPASTDPSCLQPLTPTDRATIQSALNTYARPESEFTDPAAKDACRQMRADFEARLASGDVFRGAYDTNHYGTHWNGSIHFDPQGLNNAAAGNASALKDLAVTAYHETLHALGYDHGPPTWVGNVDFYYDPQFVHLNPGSNSCVKR